jgi:hypothetical protein
VDHRLWLEALKDREQEGIIADIADVDRNIAAGGGLPQGGPLMQVGNEEQGLPVQFGSGPVPEIAIHHGHFKALPVKAHGRGPTQVDVTAQD